MSSLYSVLFLFILSLSSCIISGVLTFGDSIIFYLQINLIHAYAPSLFHGIPNLSELDATTGKYPESISHADLFKWAVLLLSVRALALNILMVKLCWRERRWDYLALGLPLAAVGSWIGCWCLTTFGKSEYLPIMFAIVFGSFAALTLLIRIKKHLDADRNQRSGDNDVGEEGENDKETGQVEDNKPESREETETQQTSSTHQELQIVEQQQQSYDQTANDNQNNNCNGAPITHDIPRYARNITGESVSPSIKQGHKQLSTIAEIIQQIEQESKESANASPKLDAGDAAKLNNKEWVSTTKFWFTTACLFAGFTGGLSNIASSPIVCVSIWFEFPKTLARGVNNFVFLAAFIARSVYNSQSGEVDLSSSIPETIAVSVGGLLGLLIGNQFAAKLSSDQFLLIVTCALLLAALTLGNAPSEVILAVLVLEVFYFMWEYGGWKSDDDIDDQQQQQPEVVVTRKE